MKGQLLSIEISQFQSHQYSKIDFISGINAIIGNSKEGKTSILRGIRMVKDNKPSGLTYNSWWNRTPKKEPIEEHSAKLIFDDVSVKRTHSKDSNNYIINDDVLEADKTWSRGDPPQEVTQILNLTEVNFQRQFDQPFLLSDGPAEIGRFFNKIVNLDLSDRILAKAEQDRRNIASNITKLDEEIKEQKEELAKFEWIESAEKIVQEIESLKKKIEKQQETRDDIFKGWQSILSFQKEIDNINKIPFDDIESLILEIKSIDEHIASQEEEWENIHNLSIKLNEYESELKNINKIPFDEIERLWNGIEILNKLIKDDEDIWNDLWNLQQDFNGLNDSNAALRSEIRELEKQMPDRCWVCGKPFKEE